MKCPNCDGSGIVNEPIYNKSHTLIKNWAIVKCRICNGSGEFVEPMTNEEWFCGLSTEEKAKRIINIAVNSDCDYRTIVEWLKETHNE